MVVPLEMSKNCTPGQKSAGMSVKFHVDFTSGPGLHGTRNRDNAERIYEHPKNVFFPGAQLGVSIKELHTGTTKRREVCRIPSRVRDYTGPGIRENAERIFKSLRNVFCQALNLV